MERRHDGPGTDLGVTLVPLSGAAQRFSRTITPQPVIDFLLNEGKEGCGGHSRRRKELGQVEVGGAAGEGSHWESTTATSTRTTRSRISRRSKRAHADFMRRAKTFRQSES